MTARTRMSDRINFFMSPDLRAALRTLKERDGVSESESIRRALTTYLTGKGVLEGKTKTRKARKRP